MEFERARKSLFLSLCLIAKLDKHGSAAYLGCAGETSALVMSDTLFAKNTYVKRVIENLEFNFFSDNILFNSCGF